MRNIEMKYRCKNLEPVAALAQSLGADDCGTFRQHDTFFQVDGGRLKLRKRSGAPGELIAYRRTDSKEAAPSQWSVFKTDDPDSLHEVLTQSLGASTVVEKERHLLLLDHTRIHLDTVDGLGTFVELETIVTDELVEADAFDEIKRIASDLGLSVKDSVRDSYADLLQKLTGTGPSPGVDG